MLTTPQFDASTVALATLCFGDAEAPAERDCTESHVKVHLEDVDRDGDLDVLLHYEPNQTGIDLGDTNACLIGSTKSGVGVYGCDTIGTR
jgi:hypothetical protein